MTGGVASRASLAICVTLLSVFVALFDEAPADAGGVVTDCSDDTDFSSKLVGGGTVTFDCGTATITLSSSKTIAADTTIDGSNLVTLSGGNAVRLFTVNAATTLDVKNTILENGLASGDGGAIDNAGFLALENDTIQDSVASGDGGAVATTGAADITDSTFVDDHAKNGGALKAVTANAMVSIEGSTLTGNQTTDGGAGQGGAIEVAAGASLHVFTSELDTNTGILGGGIYVDGSSSANVQAGRLHGNKARIGGGLYNVGTSVLNNVTVADNTQTMSSNGGAGIANYDGGTLTVTNSTFAKNTAAGGGSGIETAFGGSIAVTNATFSGNTTNMFGGAGGGIHVFESTATVTNATFADNAATAGSAISIDDAASTHLSLKNVLMTKSTSGNNCDFARPPDSADTNLSSDDSCSFGAGRDAVSISLGPLETNGGLTPTRRLLAGSIAIDDGDDAGCPATDQRGEMRVQGAACDVGAVEFVPCAGAPTKPALSSPAQRSRVTTASVLLDWIGPDCAKKFNVVMRQNSKTGTVVFSKDGIKSTQVATNALETGRTRFWQVTACNDEGCTASRWWKFKLGAPL